MAQPDYKESFMDSGDGLRLFVRRWSVEKAKGLVAIVHGFAEHSGRYKHVAAELCRLGWSVAAYDCRGHGQSGGRRTHVDHFTEYTDDLLSVLEDLRRDQDKGPVVLLGHSQGGLIAARFVEAMPDQVQALVLSSPFLGLAVRVPWYKSALGKAVSGILPALAMKTGLDPSVLSHDPEVVRAYASDPLVGDSATARWFTEVTQAQQLAIQQADRVKLPMLVLQAGEDQLASVGATRRFFDASTSQAKDWKLYPEFFHEIFNEVDKQSVFADLGAWLGRTFAA